MSKFGWDLPPGVTTSMLPGNSKEEQELEALYDLIYTHMEDMGVPEKSQEGLAEAIAKMVGDSYYDGYKAGVADERMAREMEEANARASLEDKAGD